MSNELSYFERLAAQARAVVRRDPAALAQLALALTNLAACLSDHGRSYEALPLTREAVAYYRRIVDRDSHYLGEYATALHNLAIGLTGMRRSYEGLAAICDSVAIRHRLVSEHETPENRASWAQALHTKGSILNELGRHTEAVSVLQEATQVLRPLAQAGLRGYLEDLADCEHAIGACLHDLADQRADAHLLIKAESRAGNAVRIRRGLFNPRKDPNMAEALAGALYTHGAILAALGQSRYAKRELREANRLSRAYARPA
ncbi:MAG: hypothetical protein ACRDTM_00180 [Micromonosporaceae bacterium]